MIMFNATIHLKYVYLEFAHDFCQSNSWKKMKKKEKTPVGTIDGLDT